MSRVSLLAVSALSLLPACDLDEPDGTEFLAITTCPAAAPCGVVADGFSVRTVAACTKAPERAANLEVTLVTSGGQWIEAGATSTTQIVDVQGCALAALLLPRDAKPIRLDASAEGVRATSVYVEIGAVPPVAVALEANPPLLSEDGTQSDISAHVIALSGRPSVGTVVEFEIVEGSIEPPGTRADIRPRTAVVDTMTDLATATVVVDPDVEQLMIRATASHRDDPTMTSKSDMLALRRRAPPPM